MFLWSPWLLPTDPLFRCALWVWTEYHQSYERIRRSLGLSQGEFLSAGEHLDCLKYLTFYTQTFIACEITYGLSCAVSKIAVLTMYYRIFSTSRLLRYSTWVMSAMIASWGVAVVFVSSK